MAIQTIRKYDSIGAFLKVVQFSPADGASVKRGDGWSGTATLAEAIKYAKHGGWQPEVATQFGHMFDSYLPRLREFTTTQIELMPDVCGGEVNMQAFLDGEPDCMFDWVPDESASRQRALCLLVNHSINGGISAEELFVKGQAIVALVRALGLLGFELEVWSEVTVLPRTGDHEYTTMVRLHGAGEIMDVSAVEFAVGNPAWLRRLLFAAWEAEPKNIRDRYGFYDGMGYGGPTSPRHADDVNADVVVDLGSNWGLGYRPEEMAENGFAWVLRQLREYGVIPAEEEE